MSAVLKGFFLGAGVVYLACSLAAFMRHEPTHVRVQSNTFTNTSGKTLETVETVEVPRSIPNPIKPATAKHPHIPTAYADRFRIIHGDNGLWGIEVRKPWSFSSSNDWTTGPTYNVWSTEEECQIDVDWWITKWRAQQQPVTWTNVNQ